MAGAVRPGADLLPAPAAHRVGRGPRRRGARRGRRWGRARRGPRRAQPHRGCRRPAGPDDPARPRGRHRVGGRAAGRRRAGPAAGPRRTRAPPGRRSTPWCCSASAPTPDHGSTVCSASRAPARGGRRLRADAGLPGAHPAVEVAHVATVLGEDAGRGVPAHADGAVHDDRPGRDRVEPLAQRVQRHVDRLGDDAGIRALGRVAHVDDDRTGGHGIRRARATGPTPLVPRRRLSATCPSMLTGSLADENAGA